MDKVTLTVVPFDECCATKAEALKPLEEAAEAFGAWQSLSYEWDGSIVKANVLFECADVIQAAVNLMWAYADEEEIAKAMSDCTKRNAKRGRITLEGGGANGPL